MGVAPHVINSVLDVLQLVISSAAIISLMVTLFRFMRQPEISQNDRITTCETEIKDIKKRLERGNKKFQDISDGTAITQEALLALLGHAITGNNETELKDAQKALNHYLTKSSNDNN